MQTFLPHHNFNECAKMLDNKRLGKQRIEAKQRYDIVFNNRTTGGWVNHPAVKMWKGYHNSLAYYHNCMIDEWKKRGFKNTMLYITPVDGLMFPKPLWLGDERLHSSHRANLIRKDSTFYGQYNWLDDPSTPYFWPPETYTR